MIQERTLSQGTHVLTERVPYARTVSVGFWFMQGSRDEDPGEQGLSHFIEHMLFKGTNKRSALEIVQAIDRVGGVLNAFTERELTCYYCTVASEYADLAIEILSDIVFHSVLPELDFEREKIIISNEIFESEDNPDENAYDTFLSKLWGDHDLSRKIGGEAEQISAVNYDACVRFYKKWYRPENLLVSVAGNIDEEEIWKLLEKGLPGSLSGFHRNGREHPGLHAGSHYIASRFQQVQVLAGTTFPLPENVERFYQFLVFSTAFGESMSSRLFQQLRETLGLCYSIYAMRTFFTTTALWIVYANTSPKQLNELLFGLNEEFRKLRRSPFSESEIDDAKSHLEGSMILAMEDMEVRMKRMVRHHILEGEIHSMEKSIECINAVSVGDIHDLIDRYISSDKFLLLAYGTRNLDKRKKVEFTFGQQ